MRIEDFRKLCITLNRYLFIGINLVRQLKVCVIFHFKPLGLRCKMTVMPLRWVLGHDS